MIHHLQSTLDRLESILDEAINKMTQKAVMDDAAMASAKGRALLALARLSGELSPSTLPDDIKQTIKRVREKLSREHQMLERRLDASQLVVRLIGEAMIAQDWDGTYGPVPTRRDVVATATATDAKTAINERAGR